jgi:NAD(P)-dependent dehydrogenase (short-subunit alcohol dehydrogenase family)
MRAAFEVETFGFQAVFRATIGALRESQGSYVHIGSAGHLRGAARAALSILPKAANEAMVKGIAREEGRYGVRANSVLVGIVQGGMFERLRASGDLDDKWVTASLEKLSLKRFGRPRDIADAAVFLASREANYITGQTLAVSGGFGT